MKFTLAIIALTSVEAIKMKLRDSTATPVTTNDMTGEMREAAQAYDLGAEVSNGTFYSGSYGDWTYSSYYDPVKGSSSSWS